MNNAQNDSYEHLLNGKKRLLKENEELGFELDNNSFYKDFIYMTILFCRDKIKANEFDVFKAVVNDEFFIKSISYTALLPIHIRFLCNLIKLKLNFLVIFICKIW